jgi:hypothetical protein
VNHTIAASAALASRLRSTAAASGANERSANAVATYDEP